MTGDAIVIRGDAGQLALPDDSVDLIVTSPPYFGLRSYQDADGHYEGQIGDEATPKEFLEALWGVTRDWIRVLKPSGSIFVNLGDKYAGSGGHNNGGISKPDPKRKAWDDDSIMAATRRNAPDRYVQGTEFAPAKSLMGLPWRYAIGCIDQLELILRAELVWDKPNGMPESVTDRVRRSHEQWFHFTKAGSYFANVDEIREPHASGEHGRTRHERTDRRAESEQRWGHRDDGHRAQLPPQPGDNGAFHPLGRLPGSVWRIATEPLVISKEVQEHYGLPEHFAAFPTEWPRRLILGWSPPDGVVLDPFGGTGTTAMVARALGRTGISNDLSLDYSRLARWRIFQSGHGAKAVARTWQERQGDLFAEL